MTNLSVGQHYCRHGRRGNAKQQWVVTDIRYARERLDDTMITLKSAYYNETHTVPEYDFARLYEPVKEVEDHENPS